MLWIISGFTCAGKRTFRDVMATHYGVKVIDKYILADNIGPQGSFTFDGKTRARRDPYLVVDKDNPMYNEMENLQKLTKRLQELIKRLTEMKSSHVDCGAEEEEYNKIAEQKTKLQTQFESAGYLYDKNEDGTLYLINKRDIDDATANDTEHYLLVCSDPSTINNIKHGEGISANRVQNVLIFGFNGDKTHKPATIDSAKNQIAKFFISPTYMQNIDYILYNPHMPGAVETEKSLIKQWELLKCDKRPHLLFEKDGKIKSGILFIKPFTHDRKAESTDGNDSTSKSDADNNEPIITERAKKIFDEINFLARQITTKPEYCFPKKHNATKFDIYSLGCEEAAIPTVQYNDPGSTTNSINEMRKQIEEAGLIIADVVDEKDINNLKAIVHNANCYWEIGYARAFHAPKDVVLLLQSGQQFVFDEHSTIAIKYKYENGNFTLLKSDSGTSLEEKLKEYFLIRKKAIEHRLTHLALIEASRG
ncbi:MAG: hypothetical protein HDT28_01210 [Clostridiales bacterium]|nr:hypothetical protein [Clostridiales bacterium]